MLSRLSGVNLKNKKTWIRSKKESTVWEIVIHPKKGVVSFAPKFKLFPIIQPDQLTLKRSFAMTSSLIHLKSLPTDDDTAKY